MITFFNMIVKTWVASIRMIFSSQILVPLFATYKTYKRTLWLMAYHFKFLLLADLFLHLSVAYTGQSLTPTWLGFAFPSSLFMVQLDILPHAFYVGSLLFVFLLIKNALAYITCLAARPSLARKDATYFWTYLFARDSSKLALGQMVIFIVFVRFAYFFPLPWLCYFFLIDMHDTSVRNMVSAVYNGIRTCFYFFPLVVVLFVLERVCDALLSSLILIMQPVSVWYILGLIRFIGCYGMWVFLVSLVTSFYVKIKHSYNHLFFA